MYGKKHIKEVIVKITATLTGDKNPRYGVKLSSEIISKISRSNSKYYYDILDYNNNKLRRFENWSTTAEFLGMTNPTFFRYIKRDIFYPVTKEEWDKKFQGNKNGSILGYKFKRVSKS